MQFHTCIVQESSSLFSIKLFCYIACSAAKSPKFHEYILALNLVIACEIPIHENSKKKIPDCLVDSCKRLRVNRMAVGLKLPRIFSYTFQTYFVESI